MPDITLFSQYKASDSLMVGDWRFKLTSRKPLYGMVGDTLEAIGYEETYSNPFISQEETDTLMQKFREETGQA